MFEEEIKQQENFVLNSQTDVVFYEMLIHEAALIAAKGGREDDESFKAYVSALFKKKEAADDNLFNDMAELWLLRSNNFVLDENK